MATLQVILPNLLAGSNRTLAFEFINNGFAPNDGTGDTLYVSAAKVNRNLSKLGEILGILAANDGHLKGETDWLRDQIEQLFYDLSLKVDTYDGLLLGKPMKPGALPITDTSDEVISAKWVQQLLSQRLFDVPTTNLIYVNADIGDDAADRTGTSPFKPFKTVQRAVRQAIATSIAPGNDKFGTTVIKVAPGDYVIDNRPAQNNTAPAGGLVIPRGITISGECKRKVRFIPHPQTVDATSQQFMFKLSGGSLIENVSFVDNADRSTTNHNNLWVAAFASRADLEATYQQVRTQLNLPEYNVRTEEYILGSAYEIGALGQANALPCLHDCELRSVLGLNGVFADGYQVEGLRTVVASNFNITSLQTAIQQGQNVPNPVIVDGLPSFTGAVGFLATNDSVIQLVNCECTGNQIGSVAIKGGEIRSSNSVSRFGELAFYASGFQPVARTGRQLRIVGVRCPLFLDINSANPNNPNNRQISTFRYVHQEQLSVDRVYIATQDLEQSIAFLAPYEIKNSDILRITASLNDVRTCRVVASGPVYGVDNIGAYIRVDPATNQFATSTLSSLELDGRFINITRIIDTRQARDRIYQILVASDRPLPTNTVLVGPNSVPFNGVGYQVFASDLIETSGPVSVYSVALLRTATDTRPADTVNDLVPPINYNAISSNELQEMFAPVNDLSRQIAIALGVVIAGLNEINLSPKPAGSQLQVVNAGASASLAKASTIRATGHSWEWVGYGTNYANALPANQVRELSAEENARAMGLALNAGRIYSQGMNEQGHAYINGRRIDNLLQGAGVNELLLDDTVLTIFSRLTVTREFTSLGVHRAAGVIDFQPGIRFEGIGPSTPEIIGQRFFNQQIYGFTTRAQLQEVLREADVNAYVNPADLGSWRRHLQLLMGSTETITVYVSAKDAPANSTRSWQQDLPGVVNFGKAETADFIEQGGFQPTDPTNQLTFRSLNGLDEAARWINRYMGQRQIARIMLRPGRYDITDLSFNSNVEISGARNLNGDLITFNHRAARCAEVFNELDIEPPDTVVFYVRPTITVHPQTGFLVPRSGQGMTIKGEGCSTISGVVFWSTVQAVRSNILWPGKTNATRTLSSYLLNTRNTGLGLEYLEQDNCEVAFLSEPRITITGGNLKLTNCFLGAVGPATVHAGADRQMLLSYGWLHLRGGGLNLQGVTLYGNDHFNLGNFVAPGLNNTTNKLAGFAPAFISYQGNCVLKIGQTDKEADTTTNIYLTTANATNAIPTNVADLYGTANAGVLTAEQTAQRGPMLNAWLWARGPLTKLIINELFRRTEKTPTQGFVGAFGNIYGHTDKWIRGFLMSSPVGHKFGLVFDKPVNEFPNNVHTVSTLYRPLNEEDFNAGVNKQYYSLWKRAEVPDTHTAAYLHVFASPMPFGVVTGEYRDATLVSSSTVVSHNIEISNEDQVGLFL